MTNDPRRFNRNGTLVGFHERRGLVGGGESSLSVQVGALLEVTREEQLELAELAAAMRAVTMIRSKGWLEEFVRAHTQAARVLRGAISRAHT